MYSVTKIYLALHENLFLASPKVPSFFYNRIETVASDQRTYTQRQQNHKNLSEYYNFTCFSFLLLALSLFCSLALLTWIWFFSFIFHFPLNDMNVTYTFCPQPKIIFHMLKCKRHGDEKQIWKLGVFTRKKRNKSQKSTIYIHINVRIVEKYMKWQIYVDERFRLWRLFQFNRKTIIWGIFWLESENFELFHCNSSWGFFFVMILPARYVHWRSPFFPILYVFVLALTCIYMRTQNTHLNFPLNCERWNGRAVVILYTIGQTSKFYFKWLILIGAIIPIDNFNAGDVSI